MHTYILRFYKQVCIVYQKSEWYTCVCIFLLLLLRHGSIHIICDVYYIYWKICILIFDDSLLQHFCAIMGETFLEYKFAYIIHLNHENLNHFKINLPFSLRLVCRSTIFYFHFVLLLQIAKMSKIREMWIKISYEWYSWCWRCMSFNLIRLDQEPTLKRRAKRKVIMIDDEL
jgi:hypothetical protein